MNLLTGISIESWRSEEQRELGEEQRELGEEQRELGDKTIKREVRLLTRFEQYTDLKSSIIQKIDSWKIKVKLNISFKFYCKDPPMWVYMEMSLSISLKLGQLIVSIPCIFFSRFLFFLVYCICNISLVLLYLNIFFIFLNFEFSFLKRLTWL